MRRSRQSSVVWKFFTQDKDGHEATATCDLCGETMTFAGIWSTDMDRNMNVASEGMGSWEYEPFSL